MIANGLHLGSLLELGIVIASSLGVMFRPGIMTPGMGNGSLENKFTTRLELVDRLALHDKKAHSKYSTCVINGRSAQMVNIAGGIQALAQGLNSTIFAPH